MLRDILLAFIPVFVAVDVIGLLPVFFSLTDNLSKGERRKVINSSIVTAICLAVCFIFLGRYIFNLLNITVGDFMVAGGALLFSIAIIDLVSPGKRRKVPSSEMGAVPIGTPLLVGPAVLTTCLLIMDEYGMIPTIISVVLNILLAGVAIFFANNLIKLFGVSGSRALSKVTSLFLAAIAVMMIRKGIVLMISQA